jgi:hypothetical protein
VDVLFLLYYIIHLRCHNYVYYNNEHNEIGVITKLITDIITDINYVGINNRIDVHYLNKHILILGQF